MIICQKVRDIETSKALFLSKMLQCLPQNKKIKRYLWIHFLYLRLHILQLHLYFLQFHVSQIQFLTILTLTLCFCDFISHDCTFISNNLTSYLTIATLFLRILTHNYDFSCIRNYFSVLCIYTLQCDFISHKCKVIFHKFEL